MSGSSEPHVSHSMCGSEPKSPYLGKVLKVAPMSLAIGVFSMFLNRKHGAPEYVKCGILYPVIDELQEPNEEVWSQGYAQ